MINERTRLEQARLRLAQATLPRRREGAVIGLVELLKMEIGAARSRGKSWRDIANDIAGNDSLKPDAVRLAYRRLQAATADRCEEKNRARILEAGVGTQPTSVATQSLPETSEAGVFSLMFDAQDTRGRSSREERS